MSSSPAELLPQLDYPKAADRDAQAVMADDPPRPGEAHILLATTGQLASTARMALELHSAGARVSLIAPANHPGWSLKHLAARRIYRATAPRTSLQAALEQLKPDLTLPCDERAVRDLHEIHRAAPNPRLRRAIENSTAPGVHYPTIISRPALLDLARGLGVRVPDFATLPDQHALTRWMEAHPVPFVLKADGSWAGLGVRVVSNEATAFDIYRRMTQRASVMLAIRESVLERNHFEFRPWLRGDRPAMSTQAFIDGWPANIGVACWRGEVLASICVEAVLTSSATGPSTVARLIHNDEMTNAAARLVAALGLSGMIGFDFMIEAKSGIAYLIEMNPRNTPVCALCLGPGRDLAEALVARLAGRPQRERPPRTEREVVAFFPDAWREDPANHFLRTGYHDVPWEEPELVRYLMRPELRERYAITRFLRRVWQVSRADRATPV